VVPIMKPLPKSACLTSQLIDCERTSDLEKLFV
jgi:hypothetical protein